MIECEPVFVRRKMWVIPECYRGNVAFATRALALITEALDLLDAHRGPPGAAGHLAIAQQTLRREIIIESSMQSATKLSPG